MALRLSASGFKTNAGNASAIELYLSLSLLVMPWEGEKFPDRHMWALVLTKEVGQRWLWLPLVLCLLLGAPFS